MTSTTIYEAVVLNILKKNDSKDEGLPYIYYNWLTSSKNINDCNKKT